MRSKKPRPIPDHRKPIENIHCDLESEGPEEVKAKFEAIFSAVPNKRQAWLDALEREYEETENPLCVWDAWSLARGWGHAVPSWVLAYMDDTAKMLLRSENKTKDVPSILGFTPALSRPKSAFESYTHLRAKTFAVTRVKMLLRENPDDVEALAKAALAVEDRYGFRPEESTVRRWYYEE